QATALRRYAEAPKENSMRSAPSFLARPFTAAVLLACTALTACAAPDPAPRTATQTEAAPIGAPIPRASGDWRLQGRAMAAAADSRAVEAGLAAMRAGGSAVDAAIAAHAVLGLVEPQSSGLGGGGYMLVHDRRSGRTHSFDGREAAPAAATADYFTVDGQNLGFVQAM